MSKGGANNAAAACPQAGRGEPLPKKEADLFRNVVKLYEGKQYKKAVKAADSILKKYEVHGETLAMKGLILNAMNKKKEAHELVKLGLRYDMRSHVCWHVYGLLHRTDRNYPEAIKAYKQALRIDSQNLQILRDLSLLQVQIRDRAGFVSTRHTILNLKPNMKPHWLSFAIAKHLNGDPKGAVSVIDIYLETLNEGDSDLVSNYESSELALYKNSILSEVPDNEEAVLKHLEECKDIVTDKLAWMESKGRVLLLKGEFDEAKDIYEAIFDRGITENYRVHTAYMCAILKIDKPTCQKAFKLKGTDTLVSFTDLSDDQKICLEETYCSHLRTMMPRSYAVRRIPLTFLDGNNLKNALVQYIQKDLTKGVPYLSTDISNLFCVKKIKDGSSIFVPSKDPADVKNHYVFKLVVDIIDEFISALETASKFPGKDEEEQPSTLLWTYYFRSHLYELAGELAEALALINKCIEHTPTCIEVYERKAKILKMNGKLLAAAECLDVARELDLQDRYINNKTTKYYLRAGKNDTALERISLFTKHEGNPERNLADMQCIWYELEDAISLSKQKKWGLSLKKFAAVEKHFDDFNDDQFDFHTYCIRKVTLRAYIDILRFEDNLLGQRTYSKAARGMIKIYLHLYDNPHEGAANDSEPDYSSMSAAERKKAKAMARKKKQKEEKEKIKREENLKKKLEQSADKSKKGGGKAVEIDEDPFGEKLLKLDPIEQARKYASVLVLNAPNFLSTWISDYEVSIRRGKMLKAARALHKARALSADDSQVFSCIVDFAKRMSKENLNGDITPSNIVLKKAFEDLLQGKSLNDFVVSIATTVSEDNLTALPMRVAVCKAAVELNIKQTSEAVKLITEGGVSCREITFTSARYSIEYVQGLGKDIEQLCSGWLSSLKTKFPELKN